ncbi:MAG: ATP-dependent metallopeptidase FtsH/Yme1/Tma family protein [Oscillospiraceae bacterium]|nr:ATP-dependent metallopeptidase FtsH/Yme1/Tma family protein [Oscillospiraceae bacterium]
MRKGETEHERSEKPKKSLIFYYVAVLLALMLFNMLVVPWVSQNQIIKVDYGTFVSMLGNGEVGRVEIQEQDNLIMFTDTDETAVYKTAMVGDPDLTSRLLDAGVSFSGEEIEQTSTLVTLLMWFLPLIIFVAIGQLMYKKLLNKAGGDFDMVAMESITNQYLGGDTSLTCSPQSQAEIDRQVIELVKMQHEKAIQILTENREKLDEISQYLYEKETITGEEFMTILNA